MKNDIAARFACSVFAWIVALASYRETTVAGVMLMVDWTAVFVVGWLAAAGAMIVVDIIVNSTRWTGRSWPWLAHRRWMLYMLTTLGVLSAPFTASRFLTIDIWNGAMYLGADIVLFMVWLSDYDASSEGRNEPSF